jgi:hypothetical protein
MQGLTEQQVDAMRQRTEELESFVSGRYRETFGHDIPADVLTQDAELLAQTRGFSYLADRRYLNELPGPVSRALTAAKEGVFDAAAAGASYVGEALTERTQGVEPEMSGGPTLRVPEAIGAPLSAAQRAIGLEPGRTFELLRGAGAQAPVNVQTGERAVYDADRDSYVFSDGSRATPRNSAMAAPDPYRVTLGDVGQAAFGLETAADIIETAGPFAAEMAILSATRTPQGYAARIIGANVATELSAEYLRALDRRMSGLYSGALDFNNPIDAGDHFLKVTLGGGLLGVADLAIGEAQLRAQRQSYKTLFGLGTEGSEKRIARMRRLGQEPALADATEGFMRSMFAALGAYPLTGRRAVSKARKTTGAIFRTATDAVRGYADFAAAGLSLASRSKRFYERNRAALAYVKDKGQKLYADAVEATQTAERELGLDQVHVPHSRVRAELEAQIFPKAAGGPLVPAGGKTNIEDLREVAGSLMDHPDWKLLDQVLNLDDKVSIPEYIQLRNALEFAASRSDAAGDPRATAFIGAASLMRRALRDKVVPDDLRRMWQLADDKWKGMHDLMREAVWRRFKQVESTFPERKPESVSQISSEVLVKQLFDDPSLAPEFVTTLFDVAKEAGAEGVFRRMTAGYLNDVLSRSARTAETGPLAGLDLINWSALESNLGLAGKNATRWKAIERMITKSGGDPKKFRQLIEDAKLAFPEGIPNPSQTATRRTGLAGISSAVRFMTGANFAVGAAGGAAKAGAFGAVGGGVTTAALGFLVANGIGRIAFNPWALAKMQRVVKGNLSEQGKIRTLVAVASSVGLSRPMQGALQQMGLSIPLDSRELYRAEKLGESQGTRRTAAQRARGAVTTSLPDSGSAEETLNRLRGTNAAADQNSIRPAKPAFSLRSLQ